MQKDTEIEKLQKELAYEKKINKTLAEGWIKHNSRLTRRAETYFQAFQFALNDLVGLMYTYGDGDVGVKDRIRRKLVRRASRRYDRKLEKELEEHE